MIFSKILFLLKLISHFNYYFPIHLLNFIIYYTRNIFSVVPFKISYPAYIEIVLLCLSVYTKLLLYWSSRFGIFIFSIINKVKFFLIFRARKTFFIWCMQLSKLWIKYFSYFGMLARSTCLKFLWNIQYDALFTISISKSYQSYIKFSLPYIYD